MPLVGSLLSWLKKLVMHKQHWRRFCCLEQGVSISQTGTLCGCTLAGSSIHLKAFTEKQWCVRSEGMWGCGNLALQTGRSYSSSWRVVAGREGITQGHSLAGVSKSPVERENCRHFHIFIGVVWKVVVVEGCLVVTCLGLFFLVSRSYAIIAFSALCPWAPDPLWSQMYSFSNYSPPGREVMVWLWYSLLKNPPWLLLLSPWSYLTFLSRKICVLPLNFIPLSSTWWNQALTCSIFLIWNPLRCKSPKTSFLNPSIFWANTVFPSHNFLCA